MVTPIRTWTYDLNHAVAGASQTLKYSDAVFQLKDLLVTGGWSVASSSDSVTSGASDLWADSTDVVPDAGGSAHSWIVLASPAGMVSYGTLYILLDCDTNATTPTVLKRRLGALAPTGGSTTTAPTLTDSVEVLDTAFFQNNNNPRHTHGMVSTDGDFIFFVAEDGTNIAVAACMGLRGDGAESGNTKPFCFFNALPALPYGAFDSDALIFEDNWTFVAVDSTVAQTGGVRFVSAAFEATLWVGGLSVATPASGAATLCEMLVNKATLNAYYGRAPDIRGAPQLLVPNTTITGEGGTHRYVSVNSLWLPVPTGTTFVL